jgi:osmotically-inducible protein OsmY
MSIPTLTGTDLRMREAVMNELDADPRLDASGIGVSAEADAVTLSGFVDTYGAKLAAERAAKRVRGVRAVANDIEVRLRLTRADDEIARDAALALQLQTRVPSNVQAAVHHAHITLTGSVTWMFQREAAEKAVRHIAGVAGVINHVAVVAAPSPRDVRHRITSALHRNADVNAHHIDVSIVGSVATLRGHVSSWTQRFAAERAVADAPGVSRVDNQLEIRPTDI